MIWVTNAVIGNDPSAIKARWAIKSISGCSISDNITWTNCKEDAIAWFNRKATNANAIQWKGRKVSITVIDTTTMEIVASN